MYIFLPVVRTVSKIIFIFQKFIKYYILQVVLFENEMVFFLSDRKKINYLIVSSEVFHGKA